MKLNVNFIFFLNLKLIILTIIFDLNKKQIMKLNSMK